MGCDTTDASEEAIPNSLYGVLTDVDGTLTLQGQLRASTYEALWSLHHIGLKLIPVTGRSAAWGHMMLHQWPIDAVIAESGGLAHQEISSPQISSIGKCFSSKPTTSATGRHAKTW
jgi:hydroxymethylpyrimidine pyrophosphatase-like HAD family hydrolase